jgi:hypothetical protein
MPAWNTYQQTRQAEDVVDNIYIISPVDNPVASMSMTTRATGKLHEWSEDSIRASGKNAKAEGADAGTDTSEPIVELDNYCQIMDDVAEVSGTLEAVDKYGRDSEMAYKLEMIYGAIAKDEELAIVGAPGGTRQTKAPGSSGTPTREMASLHNQLDSSVVVDGAAYTTVAELEAGLLEAQLATYMHGGRPSYLVTNPANAQYISNFAYSAGRTRDLAQSTTMVAVIDLYVSHYGELDVILDREQDDCFLLLDFNYLATPVLRATDDWEIAKLGDKARRQVLREGTFAVLNTRAHAMVDNIPNDLTIDPVPAP